MRITVKMILLLLIFANFVSLSASPGSDDKQILVFTVPKSGTHLMIKALELITNKKVRWNREPNLTDEKVPLFVDNAIALQHMPVKMSRSLSNKYIPIVLIRDPRDILVSLRQWLNKTKFWFQTPKPIIDEYLSLIADEQLKFLITCPDEYFSTRQFLRNAIEWMEDPRVLICRFEDLVGPQGGGDRFRQEECIRGIAQHIGYSLEAQAITDIADQLFGGTRTFRNGKIGSWQENFTVEHTQLCKQFLNPELYRLGYIDNDNW